MIPYEQQLGRDFFQSLTEASLYFERRSGVFRTLRRLAPRLVDLGLPYAIAGGLALFEHGYRRFSESLEILVGRDALPAIGQRLVDHGYEPCPPPRFNRWRDVENGVRIVLHVSGPWPGDGKAGSITLPDPSRAGEVRDGIAYLRLPSLIEMKLGLGIAGGIHHLKELADVVELMKIIAPPLDLADRLDPFVRARYLEYWHGLQVPLPDSPLESERVKRCFPLTGQL